MRRALLLVVVVVAALWPATRTAFTMQSTLQPGEAILVDETFRIAPGDGLRQCIDVPEMAQLTVAVSSPPGRTGETALFTFGDNRQTVRPNVHLSTLDVPWEDIRSVHLAPAGSYCYYIAVTHNLTSILPADALEMPDKQVHLTIISSPYVP
jgi:hypothetical protein